MKKIRIIEHKKLRFHERVFLDPRDKKKKSLMIIHRKDFEKVVDRVNALIVKVNKLAP